MRQSQQESWEVEVQEPSTKRLLLVLGSIWLGVFLAALDSTIVATLTGPISSSFNSLSLLSWLATAYLISNAACQPLSGRLTDIFSRKAGLIFSNVVFAIGNLICGLAQSEWTIILGRAVAGIGGGGLTAIATFVTSDLVPLRRRGVWQGIGNICFGLGSGLGGVFGGWIHDTLGWRWAFLIQVPFVVVSTILVTFTIHIPAKESQKDKLRRVDFLGAITLVIALVLLLLGLNTGGNQFPWTHPLILTTLPLSAVVLGIFIYIEANYTSEPIIPVRLLLNRTVLAACLTNWFTTMSVFGLLFYVPIFFQVQGLSATAAGLRLVPQAVGCSIGSLGAGFLMRATGRYKIYNHITMVLLVASSALICTLTFSTPTSLPLLYFLLSGTAYGGMLTITLVALISAVDHEHHAVITSASYAFRSTGSSIGITIASAVFQNILKNGLWSRFGDRDHAREIISRLRDSLEEIRKAPADWIPGVLDSYLNSLRATFVTLLGLAVLGALVKQSPLPARRKRLLISTDSEFVDNVLLSLVQHPGIELRFITDEPSALLSGTNKVPHYMDTVDSKTFEKEIGARRWLKAKAAELCDWADMLLVAPVDAGTLGSMLSGLTNTLTLALLRGWISTKPVLLIPGMTISEWQHPLTERQCQEVHQFWPWIKIISPVLWKLNAPEELVPLPWAGLEQLHDTIGETLKLTLSQDAKGAVQAAEPTTQVAVPSENTLPVTVAPIPQQASSLRPTLTEPKGIPFLPLELWLNIFEDHLRDWEIAKAVGIPTKLPVPKEWQSHLLKMSAPASLEYTILRGSFAAIKKRIDSLPRWKPLSDLACHLIFKFSRTDILSYLTENHLDLLWTTSRLTNIPYRASAIYGNPKILTWWRDAPALPNKEYIADAMDGASRAGFVDILEWWRNSGLELRYTEKALESASAEGRVAVLDWWKNAADAASLRRPLPLKVGKSVLLAAQSGRTASLAWWDASGIPYTHAESVARIASTHGHVHVLDFWYKLKGAKMIFDCQVLVGPTKNGHDNVLEWWRRSGLRVEFKTCDIEEALEDADPVSGAEERVRRWWAHNGLNLGVATSEWMKTKVL
ncbi:MFS general substrate transporter [Aspergillus granulosus]|uniref:MFS general substrate transporter n=1 Tax=Aspergillus granulosus TaxID=176169 RepID=A0ABR4H896_9EURO